MKEYEKIQPEVVVGLGDDTEFSEKKPPFKTVTKLHIELEDWLGDDIMECYPCYIVTEDLKKGLEFSKFTGFEFDQMEVTRADYFSDNYQLKKTIPKFFWMKITGKENLQDIYIGKDSTLFVSKEFLTFLKNSFTIRHLDVNPERNEFDDLLDKMIEERKKSLEK